MDDEEVIPFLDPIYPIELRREALNRLRATFPTRTCSIDFPEYGRHGMLLCSYDYYLLRQGIHSDKSYLVYGYVMRKFKSGHLVSKEEFLEEVDEVLDEMWIHLQKYSGRFMWE